MYCALIIVYGFIFLTPFLKTIFCFQGVFFFQKILSTYFQAQRCKIRYVFGLKWAGSKELILYLLKCINGKAGEIRKLSWKNIRNRTAWQKNSRFGNSHVTVLYTVRLQRGGSQVSMYTSVLCCKCLGSFACFYCKMPIFRRAWMRERGKPLPLAFQYLIFMI